MTTTQTQHDNFAEDDTLRIEDMDNIQVIEANNMYDVDVNELDGDGAYDLEK